MKKLLATAALLIAAPIMASADSAFSDGFATSSTNIDVTGGGLLNVVDTGISSGPWSGASNAGFQFDANLDARNDVTVDVDAVEPANFGSDQAFADVDIDNLSQLTGTIQFVGIGQDLGSGGSVGSAAGAFGFDFSASGFGDGFADANDD